MIMPRLGSFECVITSPPYNMRTRIRNGRYVEHEKTKHFSRKYAHYHDALPIDQYYDLQKAVVTECLEHAPLVFVNVQFVTGSKEAWFRLIGDYAKNLKDIAIWDKGEGQPAMHPSVMNRGYEVVMMLEAGATAGRAFTKSYFKRGTMADIWRLGRGGRGGAEGHSAVFPIGLPLKILLGWSRVGDRVLDPYGGTGTTARAAKDTGRKCTLIELEERYAEIAARRMQQEVLPFGNVEEQNKGTQGDLLAALEDRESSIRKEVLNFAGGDADPVVTDSNISSQSELLIP